MSPARPRLVVLGLDGLPFGLAQRLGPRLPNLARLLPRARGIAAELPELSPVNWSSFFTASGPETHGVYGFTALDPQRYVLRIVNFDDVRAPTIFDALGKRGLSSRVLNLPNMAPARPLRGMLVSGFVAPDLARAVSPPFLLGPLAAAGYRTEPDTTRGASDPEHLLGQLRLSLAARRAALGLLWPDLAWDLFVCVLTETDRLFHFLYPAVTDDDDPLHADCLEFLGEWDRTLGGVLERYAALPEPKRLVVLADHGFGPLMTELDLNCVLREAGFLRLSRPPRDEWDAGCIGDGTRAFAMDPGRIYLHRAGRYARGCVAEAETPNLLNDLRALLEGLTWKGGKVMEKVALGRELYGASPAGDAPDLVCTPRAGVDLKARFDRTAAFGFFGRRGMHRPGDAFFMDSGKSPGTARVRDVGRLVLEHFANGLVA